jgi:signal transduction histidine kinase
MDKTRVMVVEDDVNLLEGVRTVLEIDGYDVLCARDGRQALLMLDQASQSGSASMPELIVSDIMMPELDGIELLRAVRQRQAWVNIPFIFLTARGERADVQRGKLLGVDDYLVKPFDPHDLLVAVEARLNRHRALNQAHSSDVLDVKRRILTILNHEFRTPLTFVVAYADMLNEHETNRLSDDELLTFLRGVSTGAVRLRRLIENFITLVEFEMGEADRNYALRKTPIDDVRKLFSVAVSSVFTEDETTNPVEMFIEPDLPRFSADPTYLQIALIQLIDNAFKFSPRESVVELHATASDHAVCLSVVDSGRGISPAEIDRIWDTFYQINRAEFEDQGSGSGLAIVSRVVRLHGGEVSVESTPGVGSRFSIYLPTG